ncbi:cache domain-containing protein [Thioalkalicoccus limnaeus]|uniref:Cache domain-containing protein n=1 Tax=Thioalkalicoccus limnaeus TaxID=120681 RepID=A0ABV4BHW3_9GAMM
MKQVLVGVAALTLMTSALAFEMASPDEAKAMSERAQAVVNEMGSEKAFEMFADPDGEFIDRDLYVFCMDMEGVMLSHPLRPELVGQNLIDFNRYGDLLFQNMIAKAKESGSGWVDYNWTYPGTDEIREKTSYIATNDEEFFCGVGAYK